MSRIILDAELRKKLGDLERVVELCNEKGQVVGQVIPFPTSPIDLPFAEEELDRIADEETDWYTTEEVLDHLKTLGAP